MGRYLVFDIGGTSVKYGLADSSGDFLDQDSFATPKESFEQMLEAMKRVYTGYREEHQICGIAISAPGAVDSEEGVIRGISAISYIHEIPIVSRISQAMDGLPVSIENDANCAALGEMWKGVARGKKNLVFVVCGTGIGGAVIIDGRLWKGTTNNGGEFGNFLIGRGPDDTVLTWSYFTLVKQSSRYNEIRGTAINGKELLELAEAGDKDAAELADEFYRYLAIGIYNIQFIIDTEMIVLGGGVSDSPYVIPNILRWMERLEKSDRFAFLRPHIQPCQYRNLANQLGSLYHHLEQYGNHE